MSTIHSTAIIEDGAIVGDDCQIGPYAYVGPHVRLGDGCILQSHAVIDGHTTLGDHNEVFAFACLGKQTQDLKYREGAVTHVRIGSHNVFREYVTVNSSTEAGSTTVIGDHCLIQSYCHVAHECQVGSHVIMTSAAMLAGHVEVGDYAVIMGKAGCVPFARVGTMGLVGGYSKLTHDVLPYCIADGIPAALRTINKVRMERCEKSKQAVSEALKAFKTIIRSNLSLDEAVAQLREEFPDSPEVNEMIDFALSSKLGLARPHDR